MTADIHTSSPSLPAQSEDELFNVTRKRPGDYETIDTLPLSRVEDSPELDTLATLPPHRGAPTQPQGLSQSQSQSQSQWRKQNDDTQAMRYMTQPTQLVNQPLSDISSPPARSTVQVVASSPMNPPAPAARRPNGILASAMAPAGTIFRRPVLPAQRPVTVSSDEEEDPRSSDSDTIERRRNDIKTSTFVRKADAEKIPESPGAGLDKFKSLTKSYGYQSSDSAAGVKRLSDQTSDAYGHVAKKMKQTGPSRATPVVSRKQQDAEEMGLDDILDYNERSKVRRMRATFPDVPVRALYNALREKKGTYEDALDHLILQSEKRANSKPEEPIPIDDSEDELMMTPAISKVKKPSVVDARQQAKKPAKSIHEKWTSTQTATRKPPIPQPKKLDVFDDPGPAPVKSRKLIRGRKQRSASPTATGGEVPQKAAPAIVLSDDSDVEAVVAPLSDKEDDSFSDRVLEFFNTCTPLDLQDISGIGKILAEHFVAKRPYKSLETIAKVQDPTLKPKKSKRKTEPTGSRVLDKVTEMMESYEAVDYLVQRCEKIATPLAAEMKKWGVDIYGKSGTGELDMTSLLPQSQRSGNSHDSGIGTPVSDDDPDIKSGIRKGLIGQPASLAEGVKMKDYQVVGLNWLNLLFREKKSCILADDMGLGKTLQTIAFIAHLAETGVRGPHLIVVPAATLENWLKEFHRFCPGLAVEPYYAPNPNERAEMRESIDERSDQINVLVTTYTIAKAKEDSPWLRNFGFTSTIFDEGHQLKNAESKVTMTMMRIKSDFRLLLTGTPLQNNLKELISLLNFLMPSIFSEKKEQLGVIFKQDIKTISEDASAREMLLSKKRIERARSMLTPFILRRKKWQVLKDLPKKERRVQYCEMTSQQVDIYHGWLAKAYDVRERRANGERIPVDESANILMKLRQAAIHPLLFRHSYNDTVLRKISKACLKDPQWALSNPDLILTELKHYSDFEAHQLCAKSAPLHKYMLGSSELLASGKVQALLELLTKFISEGHRTLIFSQFVMVLDILELVLGEQGIKFFRLDGNTKVSERQDLIDEFNEELPPPSDPDYEQRKAEQVPVFMLSTKAGGAGINLASASRVIIFDSGFNPQDDVQAENRAHRIGQKKDVEVWRLVTKDSVEQQIFDMGEVKLRLDKEVSGEAVEDLEGGDKDDSKKEDEGRGLVEEMFFKHLNESPRVTKIVQAPKLQKGVPTKSRTTSDDASEDEEPKANGLAAEEDDKIKAELAAELSSLDDDSDDNPDTKREETPVAAKASQQSRASSRASSKPKKKPEGSSTRQKPSKPKADSKQGSQRSIRSYYKE